MGPFKRSKPDDAPASVVQVVDALYRRLGQTMATVEVTVDARPPADARLIVRNGTASVTVEPLMVTHERPGTRDEAHRMCFATELSTVMFGDGEFTLRFGAQEIAVPLPTPAVDPDEDEARITTDVRVESELRAAVAGLEERCRTAESANAELTADSRRMGDAVAATLAEVQREREQLLDLVARANADLDDTAPAQASATPDHFPNKELLSRLGAARGAAGFDGPAG